MDKIVKENDMNDELIDITINLVTNTPKDTIIQNELLYIFEELKVDGANLIPSDSDTIIPDYKKKSGPSEINILIGAVHIVLPASAVITVLIAFIKKYYDTCKSKRLKIKNADGTAIEISGYNGKETDKLLHALISSKNNVEMKSEDSPLIQ